MSDNSYPSEVFKTRQIEVYSFHRLEEILGLKRNSIRHIHVDSLTEVVKILHHDGDRGAIPYMSEMHIMEKRK